MEGEQAQCCSFDWEDVVIQTVLVRAVLSLRRLS